MDEIIKEIRRYINRGLYQNEENIRFSLVARILQKLGWDIWNPREVATEFNTVPNEDRSRVDVALFDPQNYPRVYIEIKALGKLELDLNRCEIQLRDYNRNNTAPFSIITDGQLWRFYFSQTGGEFSQKCFKVIDILNDNLEDIELSFDAFLSKMEVMSGRTKIEAQSYLKLNRRQRAMEDALPKAKRLILEPPFLSLPDAIVGILAENGISISKDEVASFVNNTQSELIPKSQNPNNEHVLTPQPGTSKFITHNQKLPQNGSKCKFVYKGHEYKGDIRFGQLVIPKYGKYNSFSGASKDITKTSRNGWIDWEIQLPNSSNWILADSWRKGG